jgi:hypothetical protein
MLRIVDARKLLETRRGKTQNICSGAESRRGSLPQCRRVGSMFGLAAMSSRVGSGFSNRISFHNNKLCSQKEQQLSNKTKTSSIKNKI